MTLEKNCVPYIYVQQTSEKVFDNEQINIRLQLPSDYLVNWFK